MACPSCGVPVPSGSRFCPSCGTPVGRRADERRLVTVVFADLVGYTTFAESRDPEAVKNVIDACFERLVADVVAFGGVVDKIIGDAIVALFGAPVAHEDDPERAVRAALRMQETLAAEAARTGVDLRMRVGVNSGEVLVGTLRAGGDYTAMGDVVNTASRLQGLAQPGSVLVGPATHAVTQGVIRYDSLGLLRAKGRDEPVPAWVAREAMGPPGSRARSFRAPLLGRDAELGVLCRALQLTGSRRRAAMVLLLGDAGVGKTRLAEELVVHARGEGAFVLEGRCVPYGEVNVWAPLAEALRRAAGVGPEDPPEQIKAHGRRAVAAILGLPEDDPEVNRILDAITLLMGGHQGSPRGAAPSRSRPGQTEVGGVGDEALQPVALCLEKLCTHRPLVFVIGELHWADDLFLAFLDRLLQRIVELPVLFVATARPEVLGRWQPPTGRHNRAILHVDPLDAAASSALLAHLAPEGLSEEDSEGLVERSGGNPLWLEELAALAAGTAGGIRQAGDAGPPGRDGPPGRTVRIGEGPELPATLRGIVAARLDLLGPETTEVLEDAAVCGRTGTVAALRAMGEAAGRPTTESCLDALVAAGLLSLTHGRESWELRSELVREVAYGTLTKAERARRHTRLAEWLAARAGDDPGDDVLDDLAHHWTAAAEIALEVGAVPGLASVEDVVGRALGWVRQAASRAVAHELWPPATALLDTAVRLVDDPASPDITGSDRAEIHLDRARTRVAMHDAVGARSDLEVVGRFDAAGLLRASALVVAGDLARIEGRLAEAEHDLTDALGQARSNEDVATELDALRALGQVRLFAGDDAGAESVAAEALVVARRAGDRRGEAWALQHLAWTAFANGDVRPARERLVRSAEVFAEIGDRGGLSWAEGLLAFVLMASGELVEAEEMGRRVLREAMRTGDTWAECMMRALVASCRLWLGAPEEAVAEAERAVQGLHGIDDVWGSLQARMVLGRARLACGDVDLGLADLESAVALDRDLDKSHASHQAHVVMTLALALQVGDGQAALDAAPDPAALPADAAEDLRAAMAIAHAQAGSVPDAVRAVAPLLGWETAARPLRPSAAPWVALVLTAAGRVPEAEAVLRATPGDAPRTALDEAWAAMAATALGADAGDEAVACAQRAGDRLVQRTIRRGLAILGGETPEGEALPGWDRLWAAVRAGAAAAAGV